MASATQGVEVETVEGGGEADALAHTVAVERVQPSPPPANLSTTVAPQKRRVLVRRKRQEEPKSPSQRYIVARKVYSGAELQLANKTVSVPSINSRGVETVPQSLAPRGISRLSFYFIFNQHCTTTRITHSYLSFSLLPFPLHPQKATR